MSPRLQGGFQMSHTLAGPFEQAHWIAFGLKQFLQISKQTGIFLAFLFAPASFFSLSVSRCIAFSGFHFSDSAPDGVGRDACLLGNETDAPSLFGFQSQV